MKSNTNFYNRIKCVTWGMNLTGNQDIQSQNEEEVVRTGISLPEKLLEKFDSLIEGTRYMSRSRAIRDAMDDFLAKYEELREGRGKQVGALMVLYDHTVEKASDALTDLQHGYEDIIITSIHVHLDAENCLEIIVVEGRAEEIKELSSQIIGGKGIEEVKSSLIELEEA